MNYQKCKTIAGDLIATYPRYYQRVTFRYIIEAARRALHDKPGATLDELHKHIKKNYI